MRRNSIHQRWREAIVRRQPEFYQPCPDRAHVIRARTGFDNRRNECCEFRRCPADLFRSLGMNEIEPVKRMALILNPAIHMDTAIVACMPLNSSLGIHYFEFIPICNDADMVA